MTADRTVTGRPPGYGGLVGALERLVAVRRLEMGTVDEWLSRRVVCVPWRSTASVNGHLETLMTRRCLTVDAATKPDEERRSTMSVADDAAVCGRDEGAFAAIAMLSGVDDADTVAEAYRTAMRTAYWDDKDVTLTTALAYAGVSRLLAEARRADDDQAYVLRSFAKGLVYDLASFTWPGWDEPGIEISPTDAAGGLAAARSNLAMAIDLDKGDLAISRAHWMLGAHRLTAGHHDAAYASFAESARSAEIAGAESERLLAVAFGVLTRLARGDGTVMDLDAALETLSGADDGDAFVAQVTTARLVVGI